jgi:hypothetical protein
MSLLAYKRLEEMSQVHIYKYEVKQFSFQTLYILREAKASQIILTPTFLNSWDQTWKEKNSLNGEQADIKNIIKKKTIKYNLMIL